jgi:hypothetical protein
MPQITERSQRDLPVRVEVPESVSQRVRSAREAPSSAYADRRIMPTGVVEVLVSGD